MPLHIPYQGELVLRGEAVISYKDFEAINEKIEDVDAKYKNPRNLCSGSVRQLNNEITAKRNVKFFAFTLVRAEEVDFHNSRMYQMQWLKEQGFDVVEHHPVTAETIEEEVAWFAKAIGKMKSRLTDWYWSMMILPMDSHWERPQSFREILLHLNGQMRFGRQRFLRLSGVRQERD